MKYKFYLIFFYGCSFFAQEDKTTYTTIEEKKQKSIPFFTQFDANIPFRLNENRGEIINGSRNNYWFLPNGLCVSAGFGIQQQKWIAISAHSGLDWLGTQKLVAVPLYINFRISPRIYEDSRLVLQAGFGRGFALGRGDLSGAFQKYSLGFENDDDLNIYIVLSGYDFKTPDQAFGYIGLGVSVRRF
jgi:hypothetical protein